LGQEEYIGPGESWGEVESSQPSVVQLWPLVPNTVIHYYPIFQFFKKCQKSRLRGLKNHFGNVSPFQKIWFIFLLSILWSKQNILVG
jgi:hypothetical protein